jgi:hypothetical protein
VAPAPAAILPELDPLRIVPLALIRLVVPALALLACEGDSDPNVSASHVALPEKLVVEWFGLTAPGVEKNAAPAPTTECSGTDAP